MTRTAAPDLSDLQVDWPATAAGALPRARSKVAFLKELPALIVMAFIAALLMKTFLIQAFYIPSGSMLPTLEINDRVLVNKLAYRFREPRRGEIIVFIAEKDETTKTLFRKVTDFLTEGLGVTPPAGERDFIKRVIGLPGDVIEVTEQGVFIKSPGERRFRLSEPYIMAQDDMGPPLEPFTVPDDSYFVMGDNRGNSSDSRSSLGPIKREDIIGKAFIKIWPVRRMGLLDVPVYRRPGSRAARPSARALDSLLGPPIAFGLLASIPHRRRMLPTR
jgi:signal peptidase I